MKVAQFTLCFPVFFDVFTVFLHAFCGDVLVASLRRCVKKPLDQVVDCYGREKPMPEGGLAPRIP